MNRILKYNEYHNWEEIAKNFLSKLNEQDLLESEEKNEGFNGFINDIFARLGFNLELTLTFGTGVKLMFPIVSNLINNMKLEINPTKEDIVLLCITIISIMFLNHKKNPPISSDDIKNKLNPEIQMKFGNPRNLINKLINCFNYIYLFIKKFPNHFGVALGSIIDMFSYTTILLPIMNAISSFCAENDLTPDNLLGNLISLGVGITTITSRKLFDVIKSKIKNNPKKDTDEIPSGVDNLQELDMKNNKLIQEQ